MNDERATETPRDAASPAGRPRPAVEDDPIGPALRGLPAERAGAGFTARLLARLDEEGAARRGALDRPGPLGRRPAFLGPAGWAALAAAALAAALGLALVRGWAPPSDRTIATADSTPAESPAVTAPGEHTARMPGGSEHVTASPPVATSEPAGSAGSSGEETLRPPPPPNREPTEPDGARRAGPELPVSPSRADSTRPAAGAGSARLALRADDRGEAALRAADARSALERVRAELDALRREHRRFEVALAELPEIGRDGQPLVFLGGDEGLGLVLDLGREATAGDDPEAGQRSPSL